MREKLDCVIFKTSEDLTWVHQWMKKNSNDKINLNFFAQDIGLSYIENQSEIVEWAHILMLRFDCFIIPVSLDTLSETRKFVSALFQGELFKAPVLLVSYDVSPIALYDFIRIGAKEFVFLQTGNEELRIRILKMLPKNKPLNPGFLDLKEPSGPQGPLNNQVALFKEKNELFSQSFKQAKAEVVAAFEKEYIGHCLALSGGNITKAAALAQKNRRAVWAIMQKRNLDAQFYRDFYLDNNTNKISK